MCSVYCRSEFDFARVNRKLRFSDVKEICRLCMYSENSLLQLFGNSENLRDRNHTVFNVKEVSNFVSLMSRIFSQQK